MVRDDWRIVRLPLPSTPPSSDPLRLLLARSPDGISTQQGVSLWCLWQGFHAVPKPLQDWHSIVFELHMLYELLQVPNATVRTSTELRTNRCIACTYMLNIRWEIQISNSKNAKIGTFYATISDHQIISRFSLSICRLTLKICRKIDLVELFEKGDIQCYRIRVALRPNVWILLNRDFEFRFCFSKRPIRLLAFIMCSVSEFRPFLHLLRPWFDR